MKRYIYLWWLLMVRTTQIAFESRLGVGIFLTGKFLRFGLYIFFIWVLLSNTSTLAGYSIWEFTLFFATFNFIDTTTQFFFREVYRFRPHIISGRFDYTLLWPISPLFKSLFGGSDVLDIPLLIVAVLFLGFAANHVPLTTIDIILFLILLLNGLLIAVAFHIFVLALGIITTEVDNTLWMYRDLTQMGRVPIDIYHEPLRSLLTFVIPIGIMFSIPVKGMLGMLDPKVVLAAFLIGIIFFVSSLFLWKFALKQYGSASS